MCDGCGAHQGRQGGLYPIGWMRLAAYGRQASEDRSSKVRTVDVCSLACTQKALKGTFADLQPERTE
jgi:hypothetical protein